MFIPVSMLPDGDDLNDRNKDILEALDSVETIMPRQTEVSDGANS